MCIQIVLTLKVLPSALSMGAALTPAESRRPPDVWIHSVEFRVSTVLESHEGNPEKG